ncbi:hypothetical protein D3C87_98830 [compost metagenome]
MAIFNGSFWDPKEVDVQHFGIIEIEERQNIHLLTVHGVFANILPALSNLNFHQDIPLIHGKINTGQFISIFNLRLEYFNGSSYDPKNSSLKTEIRLSFKFVVIGIKLFDSENLFETISLIPELGQQWTEESRIENDYLQNATSLSTYSIGNLIIDTFNTNFADVKCSLSVLDRHEIQMRTVTIKESLQIEFNFHNHLNLNEVDRFIHDFNQFYILSSGHNLALTEIRLKERDNMKWATIILSKNHFSSYSNTHHRNRYITYKDFTKENSLDLFFEKKNFYKLPLDYYFSYVYGGNEGDTSIYFILFLSALEVIHNKRYKTKKIIENTKNNRDFDSIINKISQYLSPKELQFLTGSNYNKTLRDKNIKDKLIDLIEISPKLEQLVGNSEMFADEIKSIRHYLIHEETKNDLEFINNIQGLRKRVVILKIILEYHLLIALGFDQNKVEEKINKTMTNFMHFNKG